MKQHYFIGIKIPSHFKSDVEKTRNLYRLREAYKAIPHIEDLHITLLYIGALAIDKVTSLEEKLSTIALRHSKFDLVSNGVSSFGSASTPRVIYLSVENHSELTRLQKDIASEVVKMIDQPSANRFTPHITIAKKWKGFDGFSFNKETLPSKVIPVQSFSLFTIHPKEKPMYEAVHTFNLQ